VTSNNGAPGGGNLTSPAGLSSIKYSWQY